MIAKIDFPPFTGKWNSFEFCTSLSIFAVLLAACFSQPTVGCAAQPGGIYHDVMIAMRDGVRLATDIYLPSDDGMTPSPVRLPILLMRTPYGKANWATRPAALAA